MACVTVVMALLCVVGLAGSVDDVGSELVPLSLCPSPPCWAKGQAQMSSITRGALKLLFNRMTNIMNVYVFFEKCSHWSSIQIL